MRTRIVLTPRLFRKLDLIARRHGIVLVVKRHEEIGCFGRCSRLMGGVFIDERVTEGRGACTDASTIEIVNRIDVDEFRACQRPEMDWNRIEADDIYPFVVHHELGHSLENYPWWDVATKFARPLRDELVRAVDTLNEVLADRYAWKQLHPEIPIPLADRPKEYREQLLAWMGMLDKHGIEIKRPNRAAITSTPGKYVPIEHVTHGIPWEAESRRAPSSQRRPLLSCNS